MANPSQTQSRLQNQQEQQRPQPHGRKTKKPAPRRGDGCSGISRRWVGRGRALGTRPLHLPCGFTGFIAWKLELIINCRSEHHGKWRPWKENSTGKRQPHLIQFWWGGAAAPPKFLPSPADFMHLAEKKEWAARQRLAAPPQRLLLPAIFNRSRFALTGSCFGG